MKKPECDKAWTTLYYGPRGSCKTLHQAKEIVHILKYLVWLYYRYPKLHRAIVFTNQKLNAELTEKYKEYLYYWEDQADLETCPRAHCWRGDKKHALHGAYVVIDDVSTILPPDGWRDTSIKFRKMLAQARHQGVRILANIAGSDPFSVDINFRRYTDVAFKFSALLKNNDPDETRPPVKRIFGIYRRRKIAAELLWKFGNLPEQQIRLQKIAQEQTAKRLEEMDRAMDIIYDDSWKGSYHYFTRKHTLIYDTTQDVKSRHEIAGKNADPQAAAKPAGA